MSSGEPFIVTFDDKLSYEKYKKEVVDGGGYIKNDLGDDLLGFTAVIPPTLMETMFSGNLVGSGITTVEPDSIVTIQQQ